MIADALAAYCTPIRSLLTPAPAGSGELSPDRAARLAEQLRGLQRARAWARVLLAREGSPL